MYMLTLMHKLELLFEYDCRLVQIHLLWHGYAGSLLDAETETDGDDVMKFKTQADGNDVTECSPDDRRSTGMFGFDDAIYSTFICLYIQCLLFLITGQLSRALSILQSVHLSINGNSLFSAACYPKNYCCNKDKGWQT